MTDESGGRRLRRPRVGDELLTGLDRPEHPKELRAFFAATITLSLIAWDIAFTFGAYHTVFYWRLFQILVISSALLLCSITVRRRIHVGLRMRIVLAIPAVWLVFRLIESFGTRTTTEHVIDLVLIGLSVATLPFTLWAAARISAPDYFTLPGRQLKIAAVVIVILVATVGFLVGQFNYRFTTCQEYVVAGDNTPSNCREAPSHAPTP